MPSGSLFSFVRLDLKGRLPAARARAFGAVVITCVGILAGRPTVAQTLHSPDRGGEKPDAVVLVWDQDWTLRPDRSVVYHERRHVLLNHERAYGEFADPRITYDRGTQEVEVLAARTRRRDGAYVEPADYSRSEVAPGSSAGWPAFGALQQRVLVMPGIEPGCIVELEYRVTTKPVENAPLQADIRLVGPYPVVSRQIRVELPRGVNIAPVIANVPDDRIDQTVSRNAEGGATFIFSLRELPPGMSEPQSPPWQERSPRLAFSTHATVDEWLSDRVRRQDEAADESPLGQKLAQEWTKGAGTSGEKIRAIQEGLARTFSAVEIDATWHIGPPRPASRTLNATYGTPREAAAAFLALARAAGIAAQPAVLVWDAQWLDDAPLDSAVGADLIAIGQGAELEIWHPLAGRVQRDKRWNDATLLLVRNGETLRISLPSWNRAEFSVIDANAAVTIAADGAAKGTLKLRLTGLFLNLESLRRQEDQAARVREIARRVLPGFEVESFTVQAMSPDEFIADAKLKTPAALEKTADCFRIRLAQDGPAWGDVSAPLAYAKFAAPVRLAGAFRENVGVEIRWPENWVATASPAAVAANRGEWGGVEQKVTLGSGTLRLDRSLHFDSRDLSPESMRASAEAANSLRTDRARTLLLRSP